MLALTVLVAISGGRRGRRRAGRSNEERGSGMSNLPTGLRRAGAGICVCVLVCGAVTGCAGLKNNNSSSTLAPATTAYKKAAALAANLASLGQVSGPINGTMKVGSDQLTLTGTVTLSGHSSQINLVESGQSDVTVDEILMGNHRFTSPDDKIWIDRGTKAAGTDLAAVLAAADTKQDAGVSTVNGVKVHKILTAPDKVDVAPALGIDTRTFDNESTTLRVWADDAGKPVGFGAAMSWKVTIGGAQKDVSADLDVMFTYTSPTDIAAPTSPWQWIEDKPTGIAFGLPKGWSKNAAASAQSKTTVYSIPATRDVLDYAAVAVGTDTLDQYAKDAIAGVNDNTSSPTATSLAREPASSVTIDSTKAGTYGVMVVAIHETVGYMVMIAGPRTDKPPVDALVDQILSTVEFTR
jgi:hypothetical protein